MLHQLRMKKKPENQGDDDQAPGSQGDDDQAPRHEPGGTLVLRDIQATTDDWAGNLLRFLSSRDGEETSGEKFQMAEAKLEQMIRTSHFQHGSHQRLALEVLLKGPTKCLAIMRSAFSLQLMASLKDLVTTAFFTKALPATSCFSSLQNRLDLELVIFLRSVNYMNTSSELPKLLNLLADTLQDRILDEMYCEALAWLLIEASKPEREKMTAQQKANYSHDVASIHPQLNDKASILFDKFNELWSHTDKDFRLLMRERGVFYTAARATAADTHGCDPLVRQLRADLIDEGYGGAFNGVVGDLVYTPQQSIGKVGFQHLA